MKHLFVVNPKAGKGRAYDVLRPLIKNSVEGRDIDYELYVYSGCYRILQKMG